MSSIPTTSDLANLGSRIAEDGFAANEEAIAEIVSLGLEIEPDRPSLHVLGDVNAPTPVRVRALVFVGYIWDEIRQAHIERAEQFERSFAELLEVWNQHQQMRSDAPVSALADSRTRLDALRWAVARQRAELSGMAA